MGVIYLHNDIYLAVVTSYDRQKFGGKFIPVMLTRPQVEGRSRGQEHRAEAEAKAALDICPIH